MYLNLKIKIGMFGNKQYLTLINPHKMRILKQQNNLPHASQRRVELSIIENEYH